MKKLSKGKIYKKLNAPFIEAFLIKLTNKETSYLNKCPECKHPLYAIQYRIKNVEKWIDETDINPKTNKQYLKLNPYYGINVEFAKNLEEALRIYAKYHHYGFYNQYGNISFGKPSKIKYTKF